MDEDVRGVEEEKGEYEVEELVDKRQLKTGSRLGRGTKTQYLVKWKNWDDRYNTWETEENLLDGAEEVVQRYKARERDLRQLRRAQRKYDEEGPGRRIKGTAVR